MEVIAPTMNDVYTRVRRIFVRRFNPVKYFSRLRAKRGDVMREQRRRRIEKGGSERANRGIMDEIVERKRGRGGGMHVGAFISVQLWRGEADAMWGSAKASAWTRSFACLLICRVVCAPQRVAARRTERKWALCVRVPPTVGSLVVLLENVDDDANNYAYILNARESAPSIPVFRPEARELPFAREYRWDRIHRRKR